MNCFSLRPSPNLYTTIPSIPRLCKTTPAVFTVRNAIPARDRVIDFGKHSGKMLGTLPSLYLKWVSKNLRAREFLEWAELADEVLDDPVYKDRLEWESAQKVLNGDVSSSRIAQNGAVSELVEISERFGWDNDDKAGWAKVDFGLLGTSRGGRIPRLSAAAARPGKGGGLGLGKVKPKAVVNGPVEGRRKERREKMKMRMGRGNVGVGRLGIHVNDGVDFENLKEKEGVLGEDVEVKKSVFMGREAFLRKVMNDRES